MKFSDLGLDPKVLQALTDAGYDTPTPIQEKAIPEALQGRDVLGIAQTGTGKTASFTLPMIHRLARGRARARMPRSLVLAPTRELAAQVADSFEKYGKNHKLSMALLIGGVSFADQDAKLTRGVDVLIATPGRLLDHFERGRLLLNGIEVMVVDEADRMLDMGFIPDIERIFKLTPITRQTLFFSATMPPEIKRITDQFLSAPARIEVAKPATTAETIKQRLVRVPKSDDALKRHTLRSLLSRDDVKNGIVFCNRKSSVDVVAKSLQKHGFNARPIHGDLAQAFRTETLDKFRSGELQFLIASDVAARGLDIPAVSHVFNYDVPINADDYVHRIGRTGRAGRQGATFMLVTPKDEKALQAILKATSIEKIADEELAPDFFDDAPESAKRRDAGGRGRRGSESREKSSRGRDDRKRQDRPRRGHEAENEPRDEASAIADAPADTASPGTNENSRQRPRRDAGQPSTETTSPARGADGSSGSNPGNGPDRGGERRRRPSRSRDAHDEGHAPLGFGDSPPAFILR
ncbi:MAG: DEAD/DEAH box helicase [Alphaproteobacteria bacterium]|nr:DEAD/DEAH box helicase [Alphaproteobacteria bacterium]